MPTRIVRQRFALLLTLLLGTSIPTAAGAQTPRSTPLPPPDPTCLIEFFLGCPDAVSASFRLKDVSPDSKDRIQARWKGEADVPDFVSPLEDATVNICLYDESGLLLFEASAPPGGLCPSGNTEKPCWTAKPNGKGFTYRDVAGTSQGLRRITLVDTSPGEANGLLKFTGKGSELPLPGPQAADRYVADGSGVATMQVLEVNDFGVGRCWTATLRETRRNTATVFEAGCDEAKGIACETPLP